MLLEGALHLVVQTAEAAPDLPLRAPGSRPMAR